MEKDPTNIVHSERPYNAEPALSRLRESFVTPRRYFFSRNHAPVPEIKRDDFRLVVSGLVENPLELSMDEVCSLPKRTVVATLQCAGNRRQELMKVSPIPGEMPWGAGAVGNARWAGTSLREVLLEAGVAGKARHAAFTGLDRVEGEEGRFGYGGSIPLKKALGSEVLLAYEMNGETLPREHGFPLRVVVPGYIGARSVKWLSRIELRESPSDNYFQARDYRLYPPDATSETADPSGGLMLGEALLNAVICEPGDGEAREAGPIPVRGYATAGGGRRVERVDVSADGGESWTQARLLEGDSEPWAWTLWEADLDLPVGRHRIAARAVDSAAHTQPSRADQVWNFRGYANNSWHRVRVVVR